MLRNMKKSENDKTERKFRRILPGVIAVSFLASAITFFMLLKIEQNMLQDYEKVNVWITAATLQKSVEIAEENLQLYFQQVEVDKSILPENRVMEPKMLNGARTAVVIPEGSILTETMFVSDEGYRSNLISPVIVGCKADDLYQVASGILRKGDRVNVYTVNEELEETYLLWSNVLIEQTFDQAGNRIAPEDTSVAAARINLLMEEGWTEQFYTELKKGSLRMVKIWDS